MGDLDDSSEAGFFLSSIRDDILSSFRQPIFTKFGQNMRICPLEDFRKGFSNIFV